jgi:hypothetical protein
VATNNVIGLTAASTFDSSGGATLTPSPAGSVGTATPAASSGNQLFAAKGVSQVWGRKPEPPAATTPAPTNPSPATSSPAAASASVAHGPSVQITSNPTSAAAPSPASEAPRAPTEKEKMAAALFGGVGGSSGHSTSSRRSSGAASRDRRASGGIAPAASSSPSPSSPQQVQLRSDSSGILDLETSSPSPPTAVPAPAASSVFDLLDMNDSLPLAPAQPIPTAAPSLPLHAPPPAPVNLMTSAASAGGAAGLFDDLVTAGSPSPQQGATASQSPAMSSLPSPLPASLPLPRLSVHDAFSDLMGPSSASGGGSADQFSPPRVASYNPIRLTTAEFGTRWGHSPAETKKVARLSAVRSLEQLTQALTSGPAAISHVESIPTTSEVSPPLPSSLLSRPHPRRRSLRQLWLAPL